MAIRKTYSMPSEHPEFVEKGLEIVHNTRILRRKRVVPSNCMEKSNLYSSSNTPFREQGGRRGHTNQSNCLESLPPDVLVRVLCKVGHSDLKQLLLISKFVKETALIARELHFNYSTPLSKRAFNADGCNLGIGDREEPPNAPMQHRVARSRIDGGKLASLAVALFVSREAQWPKKDSSMEM